MRSYQYNSLTMKQFNNIKKGLSLIEVSIAILILALIAGGMLGVFNQGFDISKLSKEKITAYSLAREKLEENFRYPPFNNSGTTARNNIAYNWTLTVSDGPIYPNELKQLTVTVSWDNKSFGLSTLKSDFGEVQIAVVENFEGPKSLVQRGWYVVGSQGGFEIAGTPGKRYVHQSSWYFNQRASLAHDIGIGGGPFVAYKGLLSEDVKFPQLDCRGGGISLKDAGGNTVLSMGPDYCVPWGGKSEFRMGVGSQYKAIPFNMGTDWHTYTVMWDSGTFNFYIDENKVYTFTNGPNPVRAARLEIGGWVHTTPTTEWDNIILEKIW